MYVMHVQAGARTNPVAELSFPPIDVKALNGAKTFKGHLMSVSSLAMHPTKPIVVCGLLFKPPCCRLGGHGSNPRRYSSSSPMCFQPDAQIAVSEPCANWYP